MVDPFGVTAAASSAFILIDSIARSIYAAHDSTKAEEFKNLINALKTVIQNVDDMGRKRSQSTTPEEGALWGCISSIIQGCNSTLKDIEKDVKTSSITDALVRQLRDHLSSSSMETRKAGLFSYMQCLSVSLTLLSIKHSEQILDSQGTVVNRSQALLAVEEERQELVKSLPELYQDSSANGGIADSSVSMSEGEDNISKNISNWSNSINPLIGPTEDLAETSLDPKKRSRILSLWQKVARIPSPTIGPQSDNNAPTIESSDLENAEKAPVISSSAPEPRLCNVEKSLHINLPDLEAQIEEYRQDFELARNAGLFEEAVAIQRRLILLLEQREKFHSIPFLDRADRKEGLANVLVRQLVPEGLWEAATILDELLGEAMDLPREARLNHSLAEIYRLFGIWDKAEILAHQALRIRLEVDDDDLILESRALIFSIYKSSGHTSAANALKKQYPWLEPGRVSFDEDAMASDNAFNIRRWTSDHGFTSTIDGVEAGAREPSIRHGFDVEQPHPDTKETPMQMAAKHNALEAIEALIEAGASVNVANQESATPLLIAASTKSHSTVKMLLEKDADITVVDENGDTALHRVQDNRGGTKAARALLEYDKSLVRKVNNRKMTALHLAALQGNVKMVDVLLEYGANINARDMVLLDTPLHFAISNNQYDMVLKLIEMNADVHLRNREGETAVEAGEKANDDIRRYFRERHPPVKRKRTLGFADNLKSFVGMM